MKVFAIASIPQPISPEQLQQIGLKVAKPEISAK
jgi:hypothetical protein